jgi:long-chain-fatty-acyl-CoA reductase
MIIDLPIVVCGKVIDDPSRERITLKMESDVNVRIPLLIEEDINSIIDSRLNTGLHELHFDDITVFFQKLAMFWLKKDNPLRDEAVKYCSLVTGYPESIVLRDYNLLMQLYVNRADMYDQLEAELGNRWYIDEWVSSQTCIIHAQPRGIVTNILVGNIPIASAFGSLRSMIVKNNSLSKLPKRDPISTLYMALSLQQIDPNHPITKSMSVVYWEKDSWQEEKLLNASDAVCLWGGENAINEIKKKIKAGTKILEYGPKRSLSMVDLTIIDPTDDLEEIALRVGHDFSIYNQEACFTSQELYIVADDMKFNMFMQSLQSALDHYLKIYPKGTLMSDNKAHVLITRNEQLINGSEIISTKNHDWTIIIAKDKKRLPNHPLSRTIIVHRINNLNDAMDCIDSYTQTVALYPWKASEYLRDKITIKGADRIVGVGMANYPRTGFPHDGIWTYNQLVRWVNIERDIDFKGKYYNESKEQFVHSLFRLGLG